MVHFSHTQPVLSSSIVGWFRGLTDRRPGGLGAGLKLTTLYGKNRTEISSGLLIFRDGFVDVNTTFSM